MKEPKTVYEILQALEVHHAERLATYQHHAAHSGDSMTRILLEHLVELERESLRVTSSEIKRVNPEHTTYLISGPTLGWEATQASIDHCADDSSFVDTLKCALTPDKLLEELLHRLEGGSSADSVKALAERLRDLEHSRHIQIAKFTRQD